MLAQINRHERDECITFDEIPHVYTILGKTDYISVTTYIHGHFEQFNADKVIQNMMKSSKWTESKYYGMEKEEIKQLWKKNGIASAEAGTKLHSDIENYYNNNEQENNSLEYKYFLQFASDHAHLTPFRTEWMVWDSDFKIAGSIDMVFKNEDGTLSIYDWKRCKEIIKYPVYTKFAKTKCISDVIDSNYWHYSLQLNMYKFILEKNYDVKIKDMYLICLHPENETNNYQKIEVNDMSNEINNLLELRMKKAKK